MKLALLVLCLTLGVVVARPQFGGFVPPQRPPLIPPGFEEHLPEDAKQKLIQLHFDKELTFEQRRDKIEEIFDNLPKEILEKLPLPPGLERLPEEKKAKFKELHMNRQINWRERQRLVKEEIKKLPEHEQRLVDPPRPPMMPPFHGGPNFGGQPMGPPPFGPDGFPSHPPPGFERILAPTIFKQLMNVHQDKSTTTQEKKQLIDKIMANVPQDQLDQLPLPPGFDRLPEETQLRLRQIMHDFHLDWDTRHEQVKKFIQELPKEQRRLMRPPSPPGFEELPEETREQIDALFLDDKLSHPERALKIHQLIMQLPAEIRAKLPPPPPFMPFQQQPEANQQQ